MPIATTTDVTDSVSCARVEDNVATANSGMHENGRNLNGRSPGKAEEKTGVVVVGRRA